MATEISTYYVIGCEVDPSKISTKSMVRNCECSYDVKENMSFCPKCGRKAWLPDGSKYIDGYDISNDTFCGFRVLYTNDKKNTEKCWIADEVNRIEGDTKIFSSALDLSFCKEKLKKVLEPVGLWDEAKFGIWIVQSHVYVSQHC